MNQIKLFKNRKISNLKIFNKMMILYKVIKLNKIMMKFKNNNRIKIKMEMTIIMKIIIIKMIMKMNKKYNMIKLINLQSNKMKFNKRIQNQKMKKYSKVKYNQMTKLL